MARLPILTDEDLDGLRRYTTCDLLHSKDVAALLAQRDALIAALEKIAALPGYNVLADAREAARHVLAQIKDGAP